MYAWWCSKLPAILVDGMYALWYAVLIVLITYYSRLPAGEFFYLHG